MPDTCRSNYAIVYGCDHFFSDQDHFLVASIILSVSDTSLLGAKITFVILSSGSDLFFSG